MDEAVVDRVSAGALRRLLVALCLLLCALASAQFTLDAGYPQGGTATGTSSSSQYSTSGSTRNGSAYGGGASSCKDPIKFSWTWHGASAAPPQVILKVETTALWTGPPGKCDDGLGKGDPTTSSYGGPVVLSQTQSGTAYIVKDVSSGGVTYQVEPTSSATYGNCSVSAKVTVIQFSLALTLSGGLCPNTKEILVGQRFGATVSLSGAPTSLNDTYFWSVGDGTMSGGGGDGSPFDSWTVSPPPPYPTLVGFVNSTGPSMACCFRTPDTVKVSCTVFLASIGVSVTVSDNVQAIAPEDTRHEVSIGPVSLTQEGANNVLSPTGATLSNPPYGPWGMLYRLDLKTPETYVEAYQDDGRWCSVQLVDSLYHHYTNNSVGYHWSINGQSGLDNTYPYLGPWHADGVPHTHSDRPDVTFAQSSANSAVNLDDSLKTYILYIPPGDGSMPVPFRRIDWHVAGSAAKYVQWVSTPTDNSWSGPQSYPPHPMWGNILSNNATFVPD